MTIQHPDFNQVSMPFAVGAAVISACCMLEAQKKSCWDDTECEIERFQSIILMNCQELEIFLDEEKLIALVTKLFEMFKSFSEWHPGMNQLQKFKKLSFSLEVQDPKKWIQMLKF